MVSNLQVATLHAAPTVRVVGAGPVGERVVAQSRHQGDVVMVVVRTVVVVSVRQGALPRLVMASMTMMMVVMILGVVVVVIVLWRIIMRHILQCWLRL